MSKLLAFMAPASPSPKFRPRRLVISAPTLNHAEAPYELVKNDARFDPDSRPLMARLGIAHVSLPEAVPSVPGQSICISSALEKNGSRNPQFRMATSKRKFQIAAALKRPHHLRQNHGYGHRKYFNGRSPRRRRNHPGGTPPANRKSPTSSSCCAKWAPASQGDARPRCGFAAKGTSGTEHSVIPDRIEAGTFLIARRNHRRRLNRSQLRPRSSRRGRCQLQQAESHTDILDESTLRVGGKKTCRRRRHTEDISRLRTDMQAQYMPSPPKPKELPPVAAWQTTAPR